MPAPIHKTSEHGAPLRKQRPAGYRGWATQSVFFSAYRGDSFAYYGCRARLQSFKCTTHSKAQQYLKATARLLETPFSPCFRVGSGMPSCKSWQRVDFGLILAKPDMISVQGHLVL